MLISSSGLSEGIRTRSSSSSGSSRSRSTAGFATNAAFDHLRAAWPQARWTTTVDALPAPAGTDRAVAESIALAFRRLPPRLHVVAALALIEGQPYAEIAEALSLPIGTVKSR